MQSSRVWAITTFFNPARFRRRKLNYQTFRQNLPVPLLTVELGINGGFELASNDADRLVRVEDGDILWQKERLLNLAVEMLPSDCDVVAWLDADVILTRPEWPDAVSQALRRHALVQLFDSVTDLPADGADSLPTIMSTAATLERGKDVETTLKNPAHRSSLSSANGLAWAARREVMSAAQFYDALILGSGDRAMLCAALGRWRWAVEGLRMNASQTEHFRCWANRFHNITRARVGSICGNIRHLWHGHPADRRLGTRYKLLEPHGFDPFRDLSIGRDGCWRWATQKHRMHEAVSSYFLARAEDS